MAKQMKELNFSCRCAGGKKTCGYLKVNDFGGEIEFCWVKNKKQKRAKMGVVLNGKDLERLRKFIG